MTNTAEQPNVLPMPIEAVAEFRPYMQELAKLKEENKNLLFDYRSKAGNKDARSYIAKLRKTKTPINELHKELKADILVRGRKLDAQKNELIEQIDEMIDVHQAEIDKIEAEEAERVAYAKRVIDHIVECGNGSIGGQPQPFVILIRELTEKVKTDDLGEFKEEADRLIAASIQKLNAQMEEQESRRKEQEELEALRKEKADREAAEAAKEAAKQKAAEENRIREEAAEKARIEAEQKAAKEKAEAEAKAEAERKEQAEREAKLKADAERAEREKQEAIAQAAKDAEEAKRREEEAKAEQARREEQAKIDAKRQADEAVEREKQRAADQLAEQRRLDAKRAANEEHRARIYNEALEALVKVNGEYGDSGAEAILDAIVEGKIPHVTITF